MMHDSPKVDEITTRLVEGITPSEPVDGIYFSNLSKVLSNLGVPQSGRIRHYFLARWVHLGHPKDSRRGNHWVMVHFDLKKKEINFADSDNPVALGNARRDLSKFEQGDDSKEAENWEYAEYPRLRGYVDALSIQFNMPDAKRRVFSTGNNATRCGHLMATFVHWTLFDKEADVTHRRRFDWDYVSEMTAQYLIHVRALPEKDGLIANFDHLFLKK
jgi:hypothetical protein